MIDDLSAARPQSGLSSASVVWQAPAEGGIPRYMAIFQDTLPKSIGPVRSSRYYYITWAAEWRAIYAHSGGSPGAKATLQAKGSGQYVYNVDEFRYSGTFFRLKTRFSPHNLYTTSAKLRALGKRIGAKDKAYKTVWNFAPDAPLDERPYGGTITVKYPYNTISYKYDRKTNTYLRSVTGEKKQTDAGTGTRIAPKNVVVMRMRFGPLNDGHPGAPRLEATVVGSGPAWISTNGRTIKGTWKKTVDHQADPVLRREGQRSHADDRADLRPGRDHEHGRLSGVVQGRLRHAAGDAGPERLAGELSPYEHSDEPTRRSPSVRVVVAVAALAVLGAWLLFGATRQTVSIHTAVPSSAEGAISIEADGWTYGVPLDGVRWIDGANTWHDGGRPDCLPAAGTSRPGDIRRCRGHSRGLDVAARRLG